MYSYMEYLQKCFYKSTGWNEDNIFSNITATSQALLEFPIPNGLKLDTSNKTTDYTASSFSLSNYHSINGSVAYLYSGVPLINTMGTKEVSLQDAIAGFRIIEPVRNGKNPTTTNGTLGSLLYGRMYFPGSSLEAMVIKNLTRHTQLLIKCINNPRLEKNGTMIVYLQTNTPKFLREVIYSTNEALFGFRCLYNFGNTNNINNLIPKFDNSVVSVGTELWYAARTMSPGLSAAFRYSTRSTSTGKPLTMTLAVNPILGHLSSTYTVKTSVASTFCSRYDFNFFSYASNLSLGFELFNYSKNNHLHPFTSLEDPSSKQTIPIGTHTSHKNHNLIINPIQNRDNYYHINPTLLPETNSAVPMVNFNGITPDSSNICSHENAFSDPNAPRESVTTAFQHLVNESDFSSVIKISSSLNDRMLKLLWEGRFKDFLVSTGVKLSLNPTKFSPEFSKFGISLSYAC